jgi:hypothetical protein
MAENERASDSSIPFVVLLRPFTVDNAFPVGNPHRIGAVLAPSNYFEDSNITLVRLLSQALKPDLNLRVIGGSPTGPGAIYATDYDWRVKFKDLTRNAVGIIVIPLPGKEILWEIEELQNDGHLAKTVFLVPAVESEDIRGFLRDLQQKGFGIEPHAKKTVLFSLDKSGQVIDRLEFRKISYRKVRAFLRQKWGNEHFPIFSKAWNYH